MTSWGIGQGIVAIVMALILHHPPKAGYPRLGAAQGGLQTRREYSAKQMMSQKEFYIMYAMFLMVCTAD